MHKYNTTFWFFDSSRTIGQDLGCNWVAQRPNRESTVDRLFKWQFDLYTESTSQQTNFKEVRVVGCDVGNGDDSHWTELLICVAQVPLDDLSDIDWVMVYNVVEAKSANASLDSCPRPTLTPLPNEGY